MQFWFSRTSEVSIREQLATQIVLGIVSGELTPGDRLPSTRELARRFRLHPNTVSAGYRQLQRGKWVQFRKGSGIYVAAPAQLPSSGEIALDQLIGEFFRAARKLDAPLSEVRSRLRHWMELQPPDHFLVLEPDDELARILVSELRKVASLPVRSCRVTDYSAKSDGAVPVAVSFSLKAVRESVTRQTEILTLQLRSAGASLAKHLPASKNALVGIVSRWAPFLANARTMLIAAGFHPDSLVLRNASQPNWQRGLKETATIVCDSMIAGELEGTPPVLSFSLLSEASLEQVREYEEFIRRPLG